MSTLNITTAPLTFALEPREEGSSWSLSRDNHVELNVTQTMGGQPPQSFSSATDQKSRWREKVAATQGQAVTALEVSYTSHEEVQTAGGQTKTKSAAVNGRSYRIEGEGKTVTVKVSDGRAPSPDETDRLTKDFDFVGHAPALAAALPSSGAVEPGQKVQIAADAAARLGLGLTKLPPKSVVATYKGTSEVGGRKVGVFDLRYEGEGETGPGVSMSVTLDGTLAADATSAEVLHVDVSGPTTLGGTRDHRGTSIEMKGDGTMKIKLTREPA